MRRLLHRIALSGRAFAPQRYIYTDGREPIPLLVGKGQKVTAVKRSSIAAKYAISRTVSFFGNKAQPEFLFVIP